ncbi:hypothetical protein [Microbacterium trichothecenolyticum]|uniref:Uncharacterized protein n=1 Tax=Microbacterium trichothecenolyticum TaxID=69370 RepID=A0A0M2H5U2_MICTR|nr:hypothetical protein [Microbacterium trichothecenolyticum]KJL39900.1 hypothetical protein RS82_04113 [Microbacterium trichothecenolyticum]
MIRLARTMWGRIKEPRFIRVLFLAGYIVTLTTGVVTLTDPPVTIEGALGPTLSVAWSLFWIIGGLAGAATVLQGWWEVERYAVAACMFGIGIYTIVLVTLHIASPGSRLTQLGMLAIAALLFVLRLALIRGHDFEPRG